MTNPKFPGSYSSSPVFDQDTLPDALRRSHSTKSGTWGLLEVISGQITYVVEETGKGKNLREGDLQPIAPDEVHHVEPLGPMQMQVHFFHQKPRLG